MATPTQKQVWLDLKDGRYLMRPLRPEDAEGLRQFFYSHTPETIQQRYGYMQKDMTRARASELVGVDQGKDLALGIFEVGEKQEILHAIGRYCLDDSGKTAEMAFIVRESKRREGMADRLLETLVASARERGLQALWAQVQFDNAAMIHLLKRHHAIPIPSAEPGSVKLKIELSNPRKTAPRKQA